MNDGLGGGGRELDEADLPNLTDGELVERSQSINTEIARLRVSVLGLADLGHFAEYMQMRGSSLTEAFLNEAFDRMILARLDAIPAQSPAMVADPGSLREGLHGGDFAAVRDIWGRTVWFPLAVPRLCRTIRQEAVAFDWTSWNRDAVATLARTIRQDRAFHLLPILGDALEEAGCTDAAILDHCRKPGEHARGCWVTEALARPGGCV